MVSLMLLTEAEIPIMLSLLEYMAVLLTIMASVIEKMAERKGVYGL